MGEVSGPEQEKYKDWKSQPGVESSQSDGEEFAGLPDVKPSGITHIGRDGTIYRGEAAKRQKEIEEKSRDQKQEN